MVSIKYLFIILRLDNTGEGGMVTTNDAALAERMRSMRSLSFGKVDKFLHEGIGFNYRMDNLKAALGCAQMEEIEELVAAKTRMGQTYNELFRNEQRLILPVERQRAKNVYWMYHVRLADDVAPRRNEILGKLRDEGRVMLVSTHNLGSVPDFCDRTVFVKGTVIASGPTAETFTEANLERAFGGVLRHFILGGHDLHDDEDRRSVKVITDDERPFVIYGEEEKR